MKFKNLVVIVFMLLYKVESLFVFFVFFFSNIFKGLVVCMYSMSDVRRVFFGSYVYRDGFNY